MSAELQFVLVSVAAPLAVAAGVGWLLSVTLPTGAGSRFCLGTALAVGMFVGYWLLPDWALLLPKRHWQWLAYLPFAVAIVGGLYRSTKVTSGERAIIYALFAVVAGIAAKMLVPTWANLWPPETWLIPLLAAYLWLLMVLLAALPDRLSGRLQLGLLTAAAATLAVLIGIDVSARMGQVAVIAAAAMAGCWIASWRLPSANVPAAIRSFAPIFAVLIGGLALVGAIEIQPLRPVMFVAPTAPLLLWLFAAGPLARLKSWQSAVAQTIVVALPAAVALGWVVWQAINAEPEW